MVKSNKHGLHRLSVVEAIAIQEQLRKYDLGLRFFGQIDKYIYTRLNKEKEEYMEKMKKSEKEKMMDEIKAKEDALSKQKIEFDELQKKYEKSGVEMEDGDF